MHYPINQQNVISQVSVPQDHSHPCSRSISTREDSDMQASARNPPDREDINKPSSCSWLEKQSKAVNKRDFDQTGFNGRTIRAMSTFTSQGTISIDPISLPRLSDTCSSLRPALGNLPKSPSQWWAISVVIPAPSAQTGEKTHPKSPTPLIVTTQIT